MKNLIFLIVVGLSYLASFYQKDKSALAPTNVVTTIYCSYDSNFVPVVKSYKNQFSAQIAKHKPKLVFKHPPSNPMGASSCDMPLGICVTTGIEITAGKITDAERKEGFGSASLVMVDSTHLTITPDTKFAYPDGTIELKGNMKVNPILANDLGFKSIKVLKGVYKVNLSTGSGPYGSVIVNVITQ